MKQFEVIFDNGQVEVLETPNYEAAVEAATEIASMMNTLVLDILDELDVHG